MGNTRGDTDDREWDDPPGIDLEDTRSDDEAGTEAEANANDGRALDVATEGASLRGDREPLTPGDIDPENALFVLLGAAVTLVVLLQLFI
ncbi:hypothetical protein [Halosegnis sp.]|uniref:DUF7312 domain-containing protein n=1 Tax=Halosegnis sp. TaxID=2864959 RepID=UPI0035D42BA5